MGECEEEEGAAAKGVDCADGRLDERISKVLRALGRAEEWREGGNAKGKGWREEEDLPRRKRS